MKSFCNFKKKYPLFFLILATNHSFAENSTSIIFKENKQKTISKDSNELETINVISNKKSKLDNPFNSANSVSVRSDDIRGESVDNILRRVPGTFTQHEHGQPSTKVNIRGLSGFGRVNMAIDGVTQSAFQINPIHGQAGNAAFIDENFLAEIDIARGAVSGTLGSGSLMGAVNFKTIGVDDLVDKNKSIGGQVKYRFGNNGYGNNAMGVVAVKSSLFNKDGSIGLLIAGSRKKTGQYENAQGEDNIYDSNKLDRYSGLFKLEVRPDKTQKLEFAHIALQSFYDNNLTPFQVFNRTSYIKYNLNPPSDYINLELNLNHTKNKQIIVGGDGHESAYYGKVYNNTSNGFNLTNQSNIMIGESIDSKLLVGLRLFKTKYYSNYKNPGDTFSLALPQGEQAINSFFTSFNLFYKNFSTIFDVHLDKYKISGYMPKCEGEGQWGGDLCFPRGGDVNINNSETNINPKLTLSYRINNWLQVYWSYGLTSRGTTTQEMFYPNPNPNVHGESINPYLKGEKANNLDIGFNIMKKGVFTQEDDSFKAKVNYYNSRIKNYITNQQFYACNNNRYYYCDLSVWDYNASPIGLYVNIQGKTRVKGIEIEGSYSYKNYYLDFFYTKAKSNIPPDYMAGFGIGGVYTLPEEYWGIDTGLFILDNKLNLGMKLKYDGESPIPSLPDEDDKTQVDKLKSNPILVDLYAVYNVKKDFNLFINVNNVFNKSHSYALSRSSLASSPLIDQGGTGSGRTINTGINIKF